MRQRGPALLATLAAMFSVQAASAAVVSFVNDLAGFNTAVATFVVAGTENFEGSTLAAGSATSMADPLAPGIANTPFPAGTLLAPGVTVQANTLGGNPGSPSPGGLAGLSTASVGYLGTPSDQVSNNLQPHSFDLIFAPSNGQFVRAVGMNPLFFHDSATSPTSHSGSLEIRVYAANLTTLLHTVTINGVNFTDSGSFLGVVASGGDVIGRINVWDLNTTSHYQGADNVRVLTTVNVPVELMNFDVE